MIKKFFIIALLLLASGSIYATAQDDAVVIVIKETPNGVEFEKVPIENNGTIVFSGSDIITAVLPISQGRAGEYIELKNKEDKLVLSYRDGIIKFKAVSPDGQEFALPDIKYENLKTYEIRVNIVGGNGFKKAYMIKNYDTIEEDSGPVMNMFGDQIKPKDGEYLFSYDTRTSVVGESLKGSVPFTKHKYGWFLIEGEFSDGKKGNFIVDFGATGSVMLVDYVPKGTHLEMPVATQYSKDGEKKVEVVMQGANDTVSTENLLGKTEPITIKFGDVIVKDATPRVVKDFPPTLVEEGNIIGVIGMDILRKASSISFENSVMNFGSDIKKTNGSYVSINSVGGFIVLDGTINNSPISYIVDTGARYSIIPEATLDKLSVPYWSTGEYKELRGMDNTPFKSEIVALSAGGMEIGPIQLPQKTLVMSDPQALKALGLEKDVMILGMDIMSQFSYLGVDFKNNIFVLN